MQVVLKLAVPCCHKLPNSQLSHLAGCPTRLGSPCYLQVKLITLMLLVPMQPAIGTLCPILGNFRTRCAKRTPSPQDAATATQLAEIGRVSCVGLLLLVSRQEEFAASFLDAFTSPGSMRVLDHLSASHLPQLLNSSSPLQAYWSREEDYKSAVQRVLRPYFARPYGHARLPNYESWETGYHSNERTDGGIKVRIAYPVEHHHPTSPAVSYNCQRRTFLLCHPCNRAQAPSRCHC